MNLFFEDAIPCVQLMVDKIIGDGYTVEPAPQKGHRLLSDERERTEGRPENDLVADPHEVIVPEQPVMITVTEREHKPTHHAPPL